MSEPQTTTATPGRRSLRNIGIRGWPSIFAIIFSRFGLCAENKSPPRQWYHYLPWVSDTVDYPLHRPAAYVTAKAAIVGLTRTMAQELQGSPIRVNAILPGGILTERQRELWWTPEYSKEIPLDASVNRPGHRMTLPRMALFLGADDSSAITNQTFVVDGGSDLTGIQKTSKCKEARGMLCK